MAGNMAVAYALKKRAKKAGCGCNGAGCEMCKGGKMMAEGGEVKDPPAAGMDDNMIDRIMSKRYAHGGDVKKDDDELADFSPNEFDETELEPAPEGEYPGSQEHGDEEEDERRRDIVSRIMRSRAKRDRMPRPA